MMNVHERCDHEFMKDDEVLTLLIWVVWEGGVYINWNFFLKYKYFLQINIKFLNLLYVSCVTQITRVPNDGMNNGYYGHSMASVSSNENSQREEC